MRVPLSWLKDYVEITIPVEELAHRLTLAGLEVGAIEYIGVPAGEVTTGELAVPISTDHLVWDRDKIVVGHIVEVKSHPNADRLVLAMVESGIGKIEQCVTGAPNLFDYKDRGPLAEPLVAPYAREGAVVIDGHKEDGSLMTLKPRALRGIDNRTMVCSEKELGLSDEHEGILLFETDAAPGTPLQDVLGDVVLDIELTPNMARNYAMLGIAREVAALTGQKVRYPSLDYEASGAPIEGQAAIDIREPELNPRFMLALLKGTALKPSPYWMQRRLRLAGMRPINNIVDVTNYVMLETGEPLHAFDYDVLVERAGGKPPTIITRTAEDGETLTTLDGVKRELDPFTELVADTAGALSLAGVMGGLESEVFDSATATLDATGVPLPEGEELPRGKATSRPHSSENILLEAASWNYTNIRQTLAAQRARGTEIVSEAATRFSRGVHPALAEFALRRAIGLMQQTGGGEIAQGVLDAYPRPAPEVVVDLPLSEVERVLGIALSAGEVTQILEGLEFGVEQQDDSLRVTVPDHRLDIGQVHFEEHEDIRDLIGQADLLEELARIYGYDRLPNTLIEDELPPQRTNAPLQREERLRDLLTRAGLQEIVAYRLTTPEREAALTPPGAESNWPDAPYVTLANPISQDRVAMRHTLLAGMLEVAAANTRWRDRIALFEIGKVYLPAEGEQLPDEPGRVGIVLSGPRVRRAWSDPQRDQPERMDVFDLKGIVEMAVEGLHLEDVHFEAVEHSTFFPGRAAKLVVGEEDAGVLGELHPLVREALGLPGQPVLAAELKLDVLVEAVDDLYPVQGVTNYPAVYQDIAVVVDDSVPAAEVEAVIREAGGFLLKDARLFDVYRGEQLGAGKKSLAYALTFQAPDKTLRDKDAERFRGKIVKTLKKQLNAELRG